MIYCIESINYIHNIIINILDYFYTATHDGIIFGLKSFYFFMILLIDISYYGIWISLFILSAYLTIYTPYLVLKHLIQKLSKM